MARKRTKRKKYDQYGTYALRTARGTFTFFEVIVMGVTLYGFYKDYKKNKTL